MIFCSMTRARWVSGPRATKMAEVRWNTHGEARMANLGKSPGLPKRLFVSLLVTCNGLPKVLSTRSNRCQSLPRRRRSSRRCSRAPHWNRTIWRVPQPNCGNTNPYKRLQIHVTWVGIVQYSECLFKLVKAPRSYAGGWCVCCPGGTWPGWWRW